MYRVNGFNSFYTYIYLIFKKAVSFLTEWERERENRLNHLYWIILEMPQWLALALAQGWSSELGMQSRYSLIRWCHPDRVLARSWNRGSALKNQVGYSVMTHWHLNIYAACLLPKSLLLFSTKALHYLCVCMKLCMIFLV